MQYEERKTKYKTLWHSGVEEVPGGGGGGGERGVVGRKDQMDKKKKEVF